jgi:hypothetical protein
MPPLGIDHDGPDDVGRSCDMDGDLEVHLLSLATIASGRNSLTFAQLLGDNRRWARPRFSVLHRFEYTLWG